MPIKNKTTRYSSEFSESMVSLSQTGRSANSLAKEYNAAYLTPSQFEQHILSV